MPFGKLSDGNNLELPQKCQTVELHSCTAITAHLLIVQLFNSRLVQGIREILLAKTTPKGDIEEVDTGNGNGNTWAAVLETFYNPKRQMGCNYRTECFQRSS